MNNAGVYYAILATISWSICIFPFTQAARRLGSNSLNIFRLLLATLIMGTIACSIDHENFFLLFRNQNNLVWFWLGLSGIIGLTIGDYFAFGMYAILGTRLGSVLTTFAPGAALLLGFILTNEHISIIGIAGIAITIFGVIRISMSKSEINKVPDLGHGSNTKGIIFGILAAICQGAGLVLARKGLIQIDTPVHPIHATFIRLFCGTAFMFLVTAIQGKYREFIKPLKNNQGNGLKYAIAGTIFGPVIGVTFSLYAVASIEASVAQTIFSLVPVMALFLAHFLIREKITSKAISGVVIAVLGVMILIWREQLNQLL